MALKLPTDFNNHIQGKDTNLFPIVRIKVNKPLGALDYLYISTNIYSFDKVGSSQKINTIPLLLNIPSLKESIDIDTYEDLELANQIIRSAE